MFKRKNNKLKSRTYPVCIPLPLEKENGWRPYPIFNGSTTALKNLSCHVSTLNKDQSPHPPHKHVEEEILMLLTGEVDLITQQDHHGRVYQNKRLRQGQFVYYPADFAHTLQTVSEKPANYLMFKWSAAAREGSSALRFGLFDIFDPQNDSKAKDGFCPKVIFEGATQHLPKLHCHISTLAGQAGYDPHTDPYDVGIVVIEGEVETLGARVKPHGVVFYAAGEPHGMLNASNVAAKYIVFEFHGARKSIARRFYNYFRG